MKDYLPLLVIGAVGAAVYWESTREDREMRDRMLERAHRIDQLLERFEGVIPPDALAELDRQLGLSD